MPSNYTPNYQLNQWEAGDRVQRTDFNADNAKIDAAIKSLRDFVGSPLQAKWGSYIGTGEKSHTIEMGVKPIFALVVRPGSYYQYILLIGSMGFYHEGGRTYSDIGNHEGFMVKPTDSGISASCIISYLADEERAEKVGNAKNAAYTWFALGT